MHLAMLLQMASDGMADRVAVGPREGGLTAQDLGARAARLGHYLASQPGERVGMVDLNSEAVP